MIILEGPDKAGKTTLAHAIERRLGANYFHFDKPQPYTSHVENFIHTLYRQPYNTVYDRGCLSAFAYDFKCVNDPSRWPTSLNELKRGLDAMANCDALLVYVKTPNGTLIERLNRESDSFITMPELLHVSQQYDLLWDWISLSHTYPFHILHDDDGLKASNLPMFHRFLHGQNLV